MLMFDPYRTWLGILPEYQPPSHYRLLGVSLGENDPKVIHDAARRRVAHLRQFQVGVNANAATKLINEVARARAILLDPKKRKEYDASLGLAALGDGDALGWDVLGDADQRVLAQAPKKPSEVFGLAEEKTNPLVRVRRHGLAAPAVVIPWPVWAFGAGSLVLIGGLATLLLSGVLTPSRDAERVAKLRGADTPPVLPGPSDKPGVPPGPVDAPAPPEPKGGAAPQAPTPPAEPPKPAAPIAEKRRFTGHAGAVNCVWLAPDGSYAFSASADMSIKRWDVATATERGSLALHRGPVRGLSVDGRGQLAVSCAADKLAGLRVWSPVTGPVAGKGKFIGDTSDIRCVAMLSNGQRILTGGGDGKLRIWDVAQGRQAGELSGHTEAVLAVGVYSDGHKALSAGGEQKDFTIRLWDDQVGHEPLRQFVGHDGPVVGVDLSQDGRRVVSASHDGTARVWDVGSGKEVQRFTGHKGPVWCVIFCPDGKRAISGGEDGIPRLWDVETGKELRTFTGHAGGVRSMDISGNNDWLWLLTGGDDHLLRLWDIPLPPKGTQGPGIGGPPVVGPPTPPPGMTIPQQPPQPKGIGPPTPPPGMQMPQPPPKG
jgi:hypothetical protein